MNSIRFSKYHALGNDYLVVDDRDLPIPLSAEVIQRVCHRNFGLGSDGILVYEGTYSERGGLDRGFCLRIFNPDGSEAESSGNGLRIFSRFLFDSELVGDKPFQIRVGQKVVTAQVFEHGRSVVVDMGSVTFQSDQIPVAGPSREMLNESIHLLGETLTVCCASVGNPHCVVLGRENLLEDAKKFGPLLENHELFPKRINVQFLRVLDRRNLQIEIWERGAGYTLASGSSSSAVAAVARKLDLCDENVTVHMPGGKIQVEINTHFDIRIRGGVTRVGMMTLMTECLEQ